MAIVTRYFASSTPLSSDGSGTTWANRVALFSGGVWSSIITGFDFGAGNSLHAVIGKDTYTITATLTAASFTVSIPSAGNPLFLSGADDQGNLLDVPEPEWLSCLPDWDDSSLPILSTASDITIVSLAHSYCRLLKFVATNRRGAIVANSRLNWCAFDQQSVQAAGFCASLMPYASNCVFRCSSSEFRSAVIPTTNTRLVNCRMIASQVGSGGNRNGVECSGAPAYLVGCTIAGFNGVGLYYSASDAAAFFDVIRTTIVNCNGGGIRGAATASQTNPHHISRCLIVNNGGPGVDGQSAARMLVTDSRLWSNAPNLSGLGNFVTSFNNDTSAGELSEFYNFEGEDYRIQSGSQSWGKSYGVTDAPRPRWICGVLE